MNDASKVESMLLVALEKPTAEARSAYLDDACKDNLPLREQINRLLAAYPKAVEFMAQPAIAADEKTGVYTPEVDQLGSVIAGRYKLLEIIGEGGMGEVWVADQLEPIKRRVALKLIKPGMDSRMVLARFEAERQALAVMDHPNIAKVLDAGTTAEGRPYFVMELVKGTPITTFCDARKLSPRERLELFVAICQAIQHAHTKGIIHRDIKPSNVLVALYDERPVPKVIDFGVAKAVGQQLTEKTIYTGFGALVGTPTYMAPEQATFNQLDIDTRADVYALGVLLYELLAGSPPVEPERMRKAALDEVLRLVREEDPPRPSQRLSTSQSKASIAAGRQTDPKKLTKLIQGELDWIVMKALEKDRNRRYETANGFAADVQRYLSGEQVQAVPPSTAYRLRKFAGKNQALLVTVTAFAGLLIVSAAVSGWLAFQALQAEALARENQVEANAQTRRADLNAATLTGTLISSEYNRAEVERLAAGLKADLDLLELNKDPKVGLLRLCGTLKEQPTDPGVRRIETDFMKFDHVNEEADARAQQLREFLTVTILANGQKFSPLIPPIHHDGLEIATSYLNATGRLLARGTDKTARLWDAFTGRQIAILRRADETVIATGFSPDGATAFTHSLDGVVRLWECKDGTFRAQTLPRPDRIKFVGSGPTDPFEEAVAALPDQTKLSNDRILTSTLIVKDFRKHVTPVMQNTMYDSPYYEPQENRGPIELWDSNTGRLIARLQESTNASFEAVFIGNGRWICAFEGQSQPLRIFSAENGNLIAELSHGNEECFDRSPVLSPSGNLAMTCAKITPQRERFHFWDTATWQLKLMTEVNVSGTGFLRKSFVTDDLLATHEYGQPIEVFRVATDTPAVQLSGWPFLVQKARTLLDSGELFDTRNCVKLLPPKGHKYHPDLAQMAPDGRFLPVGVRGLRGNAQKNPAFRRLDISTGVGCIDTLTEKSFDFRGFYQPGLGWVSLDFQPWWEYGPRANQPQLHRLPPLDHLAIPPDTLELWAQVVLCGQLADDEAFQKWDEPTWESKRQELASKPVTYADFPFPGHVAADRFHWLRQEFESANHADKRSLAKRLLDLAEVAADKVEATRWRSWLTANPE